MMRRTGAGLTVTVIAAFSAIFFTTDKFGLIWHTQGEAIRCERVDTYQEAYDYTLLICDVGVVRFGHDRGMSYHYMVVGDWIFQTQPDSAISYHASGFNTDAMGVCLVRTDNEEFNKKTLITSRLLLKELDSKHNYDYALFHQDVAKNGKTDPHEFKPWLIDWGMRWDERIDGIRVDGAAKEPKYETYGK